ncbi:uncharacterized protein LOC6572510 [Drosophila mojavensis]|uniref:CHK kinase-like domain-containing protein n=1 Tax=Drosophila mojavensis TaxID=7230 RepID=B4K5P1_DROMO|nr:uncharacterized protein LOC6572510 [Drosophila mojavensis]EDW14078.2 uncharacterized protein Dmoj_GI23541 [Drosophila mojavensis]
MGLSFSKSKNKYEEESVTKPSAAPEIVNVVPIPQWINEAQFVEILTQTVPQFSKIHSFNIKPAMGAGENYATLMLRVKIDVELKDNTIKHNSFMMKVPHDSVQMQEMLKVANFFDVENEVYIDLIPKFEELYKSKGLDITLAPRAYRFNEGVKIESKLKNTVLMYDLGQDGYKNANRFEGLNVEQTELVLKKIAQYHAASAVYKSIHGPYTDSIMYGMFGNDPQVAIAMMEKMLVSAQNIFLDTLQNYENCEQYHEKLRTYFSKVNKLFIEMSMPKADEFNVINHGDCWVNNFLFKFDQSGKVQDMLFVDFQNPRYGHPTQDLLYFIMTSVDISYKLTYFDYFVKYYHDQLVKHLKLLDYKERVPKLMELQMETYKYGGWSIMACYLVLPLVLLDPTESATFDNFFGDSEAGANFKKQMYTSTRYKRYIEQILPWLDNRGLLEIYEPPQALQAAAVPTIPSAEKVEIDSSVPSWVKKDHFVELLKAEVPDFKDIRAFRVKKATQGGDNYASIMLSVDIDFQTVHDQPLSKSFMLKVPPAKDAEILDMMQTFKKEIAMYTDVIPQLEQLYKQSGQTVVFAPKSYSLPSMPDYDHIILQNLRLTGYKNANRLQGLSLKETEQVLSKLALLHAASAQLYVTKGRYADCLDKSIYNESIRPVYENDLAKSFIAANIKAMQSLKGSEIFGDKVAKILNNVIDYEIKAGVYDETQFNCLNHGDCWTNNVMFKYNAEGEVTDTIFVDFQRSTFNTPAVDLYYLLISSPSLDIKLEKFDYFIRYYHTELQRNLELLKYPRHIPTLSELHTILLKNPLSAVTTTAMIMPTVLVDPTENASIDTMMGTNEESQEFKNKLFCNDRYRRHAEAVYPWLNSKGLLDIE